MLHVVPQSVPVCNQFLNYSFQVLGFHEQFLFGEHCTIDGDCFSWCQCTSEVVFQFVSVCLQGCGMLARCMGPCNAFDEHCTIEGD